MRKTFNVAWLFLLLIINALLCGQVLPDQTQTGQVKPLKVRIKDIASIQGIRENQLTGIGLVTGLSGKGDSSGSKVLKKVLKNLLDRFEINVKAEDIKSKNTAIVLITAELPSFARPGDRIDVKLSSLGDASSLEGGVLLQTNLNAANGRAYAVAQGVVTTSGPAGGMTTVGSIPRAAIVEREVLSNFVRNGYISIVLHNPDFLTARNVEAAITEKFPDTETKAVDASLVTVLIPQAKREDVVGFIADIQAMSIETDFKAKVVINPRSGIVVVGKDVKIGKVAISFKGNSVSVGGAFDSTEPKDLFVLDGVASVEDFVSILLDAGLKTEIIIEILKSIDQAGALYGELEIM